MYVKRWQRVIGQLERQLKVQGCYAFIRKSCSDKLTSSKDKKPLSLSRRAARCHGTGADGCVCPVTLILISQGGERGQRVKKTEVDRGWLERSDRTELEGEHRPDAHTQTHTHKHTPVSARRDEIYSYLPHPAENDTHVKQAQAAILRQDELHIEDTVI